MNPSDKPKWHQHDERWVYLHTVYDVDFYKDEDGDITGKFGHGYFDWTYIGEKEDDDGPACLDWLKLPKSARDHLTALDALHR